MADLCAYHTITPACARTVQVNFCIFDTLLYPEHRLLITINKTQMKFIDIDYLIFSIGIAIFFIDYVGHF